MYLFQAFVPELRAFQRWEHPVTWPSNHCWFQDCPLDGYRVKIHHFLKNKYCRIMSVMVQSCVNLHVVSGSSGNCLLKDLAAVKETGTSVPGAANADLKTGPNVTKWLKFHCFKRHFGTASKPKLPNKSKTHKLHRKWNWKNGPSSWTTSCMTSLRWFWA